VLDWMQRLMLDKVFDKNNIRNQLGPILLEGEEAMKPKGPFGTKMRSACRIDGSGGGSVESKLLGCFPSLSMCPILAPSPHLFTLQAHMDQVIAFLQQPVESGWAMLGMVLAAAVFWMQYVDLKDRFLPEPRTRLLMAFGLGVLAGGLALGCFTALDLLGLPDPWSRETSWMAVYCLGVIGPVEEGAKILVAWFVVFRWPEFDEPLDGFVYAAAISLGFASLENLLHLPGLSLREQLARTATLPLTHTLFGAVWGLGIARARMLMPPGRKRQLWQVGSVLLAMLLHGVYDLLIFAWQASLVTSGIALVLWIFVIWRAHKLAKTPRIWPHALR